VADSPLISELEISVGDGSFTHRATGEGAAGPAALRAPGEIPDRDSVSFEFDRGPGRHEVTVPFVSVSGESGIVVLTVDADQLRRHLMRPLPRTLLVVLAISLILGLSLHRLIRRVVTQPLRQLVESAERVAGGDLEARVVPRADNEIGAAARAVNAMADTLISQSESLRASEERHRALFQSATDACYVIDAETRAITAANREAVELMGHSESELTGQRIDEFIPASQHGILDAIREQLDSHGEVHGCERLTVLARDGKEVPVSLNARRLALGPESLVIVSIRDISDQRGAAAEVERQLSRVTALNVTSRACSASLEPREIHRAIFDQVRETMPCDAFLIELWDPRSGMLTPEFLTDLIDGEPREITNPGGPRLARIGPITEVVTQRRSVRIHRGADGGPEAGLTAFGDRRRLSRSILYVPMVAGDRVVGVLSAQSYEAGAYTQEDLDLLTAIGSQAALAVNNAQLHQAAQRGLAMRDSLNHIAKSMGSTLDLRNIAEIVHLEVCRLVPCDAFFLTMVGTEPGDHRLLLAIDTIDGRRRDVTDRTAEQTVSAKAKHTTHIVNTRRAHLEQREPEELPDRPYAVFGDTSRRSSSLMYVPLIARDRVVGVLSVQSYRHRAHSEADLTLLQEIGDLTALALENARLYQEMATSESRHRAIVESANVSIVLTDTASRIVMWNPGAERIFGMRANDMMGQSLGSIFHGISGGLERLQEALRHRGTWTGECQAQHSDGTMRELVLSVCNVTDTRGEPIGHVVIASDLTEKKGLERALLQAQKMESIGTLAGGIAHDFNNLLTSIMGYSSFLQTLADPGTRLSRDLDQIERAASRASDLTGQLLAFSRKQLIQHEFLNINDVIEETVRLMERTLGKHITIEMELEPNPHLIEADSTQMQQVIMNLAINARDAMPRGGVLRLITTNRELSEAFCRRHADLTPGPHTLISVSDTGLGMDEETRERIFDPFFTTKAVGEGSGLGLATVYGIVHSHGGIIEVQSSPNEGTTFLIYLPASAECAPSTDETPEESEVRGGFETVLLVDDETMILRLGASILERYGYTALTATSGRAALDLFRARRDEIGLVVVDMVMPEMNGAELAERLLEIDAQCRVLLSSGYTLDQSAEILLADGSFIGFLPKPYRMGQLARHVRHALDAPVKAVS
jgi:PAS domain S-box-containing protein